MSDTFTPSRVDAAAREFKSRSDDLRDASKDTWSEALRAFVYLSTTDVVLKQVLAPLRDVDMGAAHFFSRANALDPSLRAHPELTELPPDRQQSAALVLQLLDLVAVTNVALPTITLKFVGKDGTWDDRIRRLHRRLIAPLDREVRDRLDTLRSESAAAGLSSGAATTSRLPENAEKFLHMVWEFFLENGQWPTVPWVYTQTRYMGPVDDLCEALGKETIRCGEDSNSVTRIRLRALVSFGGRLRYPLDGADREADHVVAAIRYCAKRFIDSDGRPGPIAISEFIPALGLTELEARRVRQLLADTAGEVWLGASGGDVFTALAPKIVQFEHLPSLSDYFAAIDARAALAEHRRDGRSTDGSADSRRHVDVSGLGAPTAHTDAPLTVPEAQKQSVRDRWIAACVVAAAIGSIAIFTLQSRSRQTADIALNTPQVVTFTRTDGTQVQCNAPRPSVVEKARSTEVRTEVEGAVRAVHGQVSDSSSLQRIRGESQGTDLFEAKKFAICEAYGNNELTRQQSSDLLAYLVRGTLGQQIQTP